MMSRTDEVVLHNTLDEAGTLRTYHLLMRDEHWLFEGLLFDTRYSLDDIAYDEASHRLSLIARHSRIRYRLKCKWRILPLPTFQTVWQSEIRVTFFGVTSFSLKDEARIEEGHNASVYASDGRVTLEGMYPVSLTILTDGPPVVTALALPREKWMTDEMTRGYTRRGH